LFLAIGATAAAKVVFSIGLVLKLALLGKVLSMVRRPAQPQLQLAPVTSR
jgi:hypothetical protein